MANVDVADDASDGSMGDVSLSDAESEFKGPLACLWSRVINRDTPPIQRLRLRTLGVLAISMFGPTLLFLGLNLMSDAASVFYILGLLIALLGELYLLSVVIIKQHVSDSDLAVLAAIMLCGVIIIDFDLRTSNKQFWFMIITCFDCFLVLSAPDTISFCMIAGMMVWLAVAAIESNVRFGLYDLPGLASSAIRYDWICGCDEVPCKQDLTSSIADFVVASITLLLAYHITLNFARETNRQRDRMERAVAVANEVAERLVAFDLESARERLNANDALSLAPAFYSAFENLLNNLEEYRPYLPQSLLGQFDDECMTAVSTNGVAPGVSDQHATIMFTDIRASTKVWATCPEGMKRALKQHNRCLRECIAAHNGYEVKTIGDAFMVAFPALQDAVRCGLAIHNSLLEIEWPEALYGVPECAKDDDGLWGGLCLRIGVEEGPVETELNDLTQRYDYFGDTVNRAARLEAQCPPGGVAGVAERMGPLFEQMGVDEECVRQYSAELKGFDGGAVKLVAGVPQKLEGRWGFSHADCVALAVSKAQALAAEGTRRRASGRSTRTASTAPSSANIRITSPRSVDSDHMSMMSTAHGQREHGTIAAINLAPTVEGLAALQVTFQRTLQCLQATSGTVVATVHTLVVASWCGRGGLAHRESAARFVSMFRHHTSNAFCAVPGSNIGVATGTIVQGAIGTTQQRFITTVGGCVALSMHLARMAPVWNVRDVYAVRMDTIGAGARSLQAAELEFHSNIEFAMEGSALCGVSVYEIVVERRAPKVETGSDALALSPTSNFSQQADLEVLGVSPMGHPPMRRVSFVSPRVAHKGGRPV